MPRCPRCFSEQTQASTGGICEGCVLEAILSPPQTLVGDEVFGAYEIVCQIGEGGLGIVYLAEQQQPVRREVALKVIKPGLASREILARLATERQVLAVLDHPQIARMIDAGTSSAGRPFFVMEFVDGLPITEYCDSRSLDIERRLVLFAEVCHAVDYAHGKGILHRDIKPSNILIAENAGAPAPKIIDFGIAKAMSGRLTGQTIQTEAGQLLGTPEYMSPEQADLSNRGLEATTDVYSLGVVLYELLCGASPCGAERLREAGLTEVLRIVREEEPPGLRASLRALGPAAATRARERGTSVAALERQISGDLASIVQTALAKDRRRRYSSAAALASDIKRFLHREPVLAHPPGLLYRARKLVRRRQGPLIAAVAALAVLWSGGRCWFRDGRILCRGIVFRSLRPPDTRRFPRSPPMGSVSRLPGEAPATALARFTSRPWAVSPLLVSPATRPKISGRLGLPMGRNLPSYGSEVTDTKTSSPSGPVRNGGSWLPSAARIRGFADEPRLHWSPDGMELASVEATERKNGCGIVLIDVRSGKKRMLTRPSGSLADVEPAFSPDGKWVAFVRQVTTSIGDIFLVPSTGGEPRRITFDDREVRGFCWSPDGKGFIVASRRQGIFLSLWKIPVSGGTAVRLMEGPSAIGFPSASRTGDRIAYVNYRDDYNIWRFSGGSNQPLIESRSTDWSPQYSPDGRKIAFVTDRTGNANVWLADASGGNQVRLTDFPTSPAGSPAWSPDGRRLAFDVRTNGQSDIYLIDAEPGGKPSRLTLWPSDEAVPSWSRDGNYVYFASTRSGAWNVYKVPAAGGEPVQMTRGRAFRPVESVDGRFLYFIRGQEKEIWRMPLQGNQREELVLAQFVTRFSDWALGPGGLFFLKRDPAGAKNSPALIELLAAGQDTPQQLGQTQKAPNGFTVSPDGMSFLYAQMDQSGSDILLLEH